MRMVNAGFPERNRYGFEKVDRPARLNGRERRSIKNLRRLQSIGLFTNFRQFNRHADTRNSSAGGSQEPIAGINRDEIKRVDGEMFFLLRMAFWLGLVLVLLPREKTPESEKLPQLGASEAVSAATAAVSDLSQFCKRQPGACQVGGQAATVLGQRAQDGARKLYQIITDKRPSDHTGSIGGAENADPAAARPDTLTADDLRVEWRLGP
jgi:hypothetical protein